MLAKAIHVNRQLTIILLFCSMNLFAKSLTPPNQPKPHRFYVCYKNITFEAQDQFSGYRVYHYHGCQISSIPCYFKGSQAAKHFGNYRTYRNAINGYFMCAYS